MAVDSSALTPERAGVWTLVREGFDPLTERGVEAVFAIANGNFGVRAAVEEGNNASNPMLIVGGVYVPTTSPAAQTLLRLPDPAVGPIWIDGRQLEIAAMRTLEHVRRLDFQRGETTRAWSFVDAAGRRWRLESMRAASAADRACCLHRLSLRLEEGGPATVAFGVPLAVAAAPASARDVAQPPLPVEIVSAIEAPPLGALRTLHRFHGDVRLRDGQASAAVEPGTAVVRESVSVVGPAEGAARPGPFDDLLARHREVWQPRSALSDVTVDGSDEVQRAVRFAMYHLLSAAGAPDDGRASIAARNLSGEAYHGHVFWDTEVFVLPAIVGAWPEAARACLLYRYRTLGAARDRARVLGYAGALYAWESTDTGEERTPSSVVMPDGKALRILNGEQEHHISAAVPYGVIRHWQATGDDAFMLDYGGEMLVECARFWCSRVTLSDDEYAIRNVIGPDEYHTSVINNAYTNAMAAWTLRAAAAFVRWARAAAPEPADALARRLTLDAREPEEWEHAAAHMARSSFHDGQVVEQFDGFFGLRPVDVLAYRAAGVPLDVAVGVAAVQSMRAAKQADALMAAALLPEAWDEQTLRATFDYYEPITAHASSLSPPVHALISAWLRDADRCRAYLEQTIRIDLGDGFRAAAGGVHLGALGGLWQALVYGLAGLKYSERHVELDPFVVAPLTRLAFSMKWRGRLLRFDIRDGMVTAAVSGAPVTVRVNHAQKQIDAGETADFPFDPAVTFWSARKERAR